MTADLALGGPAVRPTSWQQVVLILGLAISLLTSTVILALIHANVSDILNALLAVVVLALTALGYDAKRNLEGKMDTVQGSVQTVKEISNGRLTEMMEQNKALAAQMTALQAQNTQLALQVPTQPAAIEGPSTGAQTTGGSFTITTTNNASP